MEFCFVLTIAVFFLWLAKCIDGLDPPDQLEAFIHGTTASVFWTVSVIDLAFIECFRVTYEVGSSPGNYFKVTHDIQGNKRSYILRGLAPLSTYRLFMVTIGNDGTTSNISETLEFTTSLPNEIGLYEVQRKGVYPEELVIILLIIMVWMIVVVIFVKQWDSIRLLQPVEPRYKHNPKNLETIRVVKRAQDSVIYKNYNRKLSITMVEREKRRLQRMNTAPVLPTNSLVRMSTLPTIQMEEVTTEM